MSDLSVITVTYNSAAVLADCLRSLSEHLPDAEVIVVDNGSEDETVELAGRSPNVRVVAGHGNVGFGAGVNLGAHAASGGLLLVLNPDATLVAVDRSQLELLREAPITGVVGCRVRGETPTHLKFAAWGWRSELYWALGQRFLLPREVTVRRPKRSVRAQAQWVAGAAFVVRRREFLEVGGFDDDFFLYFEDFDLSRAYRDRGWPIRTTDAFTVSHTGLSSSPRDEHAMAAYTLLSLIQYVHKWEGPGAARDAASRCLRLLAAIEVIAKLCGRVPLLGGRAARKRESARAVRSALVAAATQSPVADTYAAATDALRHALDNRRA
jgi:N-acetylglucosaminyl-diphospho-decaprenol L-rhamnosyltransferase